MSIFTQDDDTPSSPAPVDPALVRLIGERFISRKDVKAQEFSAGDGWAPVTSEPKGKGHRVPFSMQDFTDHLQGTRTLGHYLVGTDNTCKLFAFDLDLDKTGFYLDDSEDEEGFTRIMDGAIECNPRDVWATQQPAPAYEYFTIGLRLLAEGLAHRIVSKFDIPVAIASSGGKGLHVYGFTGMIDGPQPADAIREVALEVLRGAGSGMFSPTRGDNFWKSNHEHGRFSSMTIEVFPKQDNLDGKDLGNLMRLPLGVNRKTNRRGYFVNCKAASNKLMEMDALRALSGDLPWE